MARVPKLSCDACWTTLRRKPKSENLWPGALSFVSACWLPALANACRVGARRVPESHRYCSSDLNEDFLGLAKACVVCEL